MTAAMSVCRSMKSDRNEKDHDEFTPRNSGSGAHEMHVSASQWTFAKLARHFGSLFELLRNSSMISGTS